MHHILNTGRKYGRIALRLLYPVRCPFCDEIVPGFEKLICDTCREELTPIKDYCMKCGKHVGQGEEYCSSCREISHNFSRGRCLLPYEGKTRKSIYRYKCTDPCSAAYQAAAEARIQSGGTSGKGAWQHFPHSGLLTSDMQNKKYDSTEKAHVLTASK